MPLIDYSRPRGEDHGAPVEDRFIRVADDDALPDSAPVLLTLERFLKEEEALKGRNGEIGLIWPHNKPIDEIAPYLPRLALIALVFPSFRDGRAYSQARILRERLGWTGRLRATGGVLRDQFLLMARSGFDEFEPVKAADAAAFDEALSSYSVFYQPTGDGRKSLLRARLGRHATREDAARHAASAAAQPVEA